MPNGFNHPRYSMRACVATHAPGASSPIHKHCNGRSHQTRTDTHTMCLTSMRPVAAGGGGWWRRLVAAATGGAVAAGGGGMCGGGWSGGGWSGGGWWRRLVVAAAGCAAAAGESKSRLVALGQWLVATASGG